MFIEMKPPRLTQISCAAGVRRYWIERLRLRRGIEHPEQVAGRRDGVGELGVDVRHQEEAVVGGLGGRLALEEVGDEARLVVEEAAGRVVEHRVGCLAERGVDDVVRSAVAVREDLAERLVGRLDLRRGPLLLAPDPLVVDLGTRTGAGRCPRSSRFPASPTSRRTRRRRTTAWCCRLRLRRPSS